MNELSLDIQQIKVFSGPTNVPPLTNIHQCNGCYNDIENNLPHSIPDKLQKYLHIEYLNTTAYCSNDLANNLWRSYQMYVSGISKH